MLSENQFPGSIDVEDLANSIMNIVDHYPVITKDFDGELNDISALISTLVSHPIAAWIEGRGTKGTKYFKYEEKLLSTDLGDAPEDRQVLESFTQEICDYRISRYLERLQGKLSYAPKIVCNVSHSNGKPILFLPDRTKTPGIPEGWYPITANDQSYRAKFAKIAINVVSGPDETANALHDLLRNWFGDQAGAPGTNDRVIFRFSDDSYMLEPIALETTGPTPWNEYMRAEIPPFWGFEFNTGSWNQGYVHKDSHVFLLVTLEKTGMQDDHQYEDKFLSPTVFQWSSQNRHTQEGKIGQMLKNHVREGVVIHLFVRAIGKTPNGKASPFIYSGDVVFKDWEGSKPIHIRWKLSDPVPEHLWATFKIK
jgi:hypothetical protein